MNLCYYINIIGREWWRVRGEGGGESVEREGVMQWGGRDGMGMERWREMEGEEGGEMESDGRGRGGGEMEKGGD